jgi:hypothetical protein
VVLFLPIFEAMATRHISVDLACPDLVPDRLLRVTSVRFERIGKDDSLVRVRYEIRPPLPPRRKPGDVQVWWSWSATDDAGTEYWDMGGAYGEPPGADYTDGVLSLRPVPPEEARELRVTLRPWCTWVGGEETARECTVVIDLAAR